MNKKIKSRVEIHKEIFMLFENYKTESELIDRINSYLENITGKELLSEEGIRQALAMELVVGPAISKKKKYSDKIINLFVPVEKQKSIKKSFRNSEKILSFYSQSGSGEIDFVAALEQPSIAKLPYDIVITCKAFEKYRNLIEDKQIKYKISTVNYPTIFCEEIQLKKILSENKTFKKLYNIIKENYDVAKLLKDYVHDSKQKCIVNLIIDKVIPLNSIFVYFDIDKNIKENTQALYLLLNKKIPRNTIQLALKRDIANIKKGKFSVPYM